MPVRSLQLEDESVWWALRGSLWPDLEPRDLEEPATEFDGAEQACFVWVDEGTDEIRGFAEASLRRYAAGCSTSPVGFLEAWYVVAGHRRTGVGAALVAAVERWTATKGCVEMGSDAILKNEVSRVAHAALGFAEIEETVQFAKRLKHATKPSSVERPGSSAAVSLRPVDEKNVRAVCDLAVGPHQRAFVAPNAVSLAQAYATTKAWVRAIYADATLVGFLMLSDDDVAPRYYLWRFMVDQRHQRCGFGRRAMELMEEYVQGRPAGDRVYLSYVPGSRGPEAFYASIGYVDTGRVHHGELEAVKTLA